MLWVHQRVLHVREESVDMLVVWMQERSLTAICIQHTKVYINIAFDITLASDDSQYIGQGCT